MACLVMSLHTAIGAAQATASAGARSPEAVYPQVLRLDGGDVTYAVGVTRNGVL
jgi:hypothetical protein